ncbi:unnamed protein product [Leptidea sinapis]|uniref:Importin subunit alpha n=1 Tax=Leptidea sinapis TaxID=189913 RepID=A0A5E4R6E9_9NEOP|nr:unnamed protein product [Leptidea sinapis]
MAEAQRSRLAAYKNTGQGVTELRRKRAELSVSLRKQARDEQLQKRRAMSPDESDVIQDDEKLMTPEEIVKGLKSSDIMVKTTAARAARRMLSKEQNPPIEVMIKAGVIKPLVEALDRDDCHDLQFEAAWAITNIASGTHAQTMEIVESGAIPKLVVLLSQGGAVGEQCAWALGNIAGDGAGPRDLVLSHGAMPALLPHLNENAVITQLRTAAWALSNFCRNKNPLVKFELVASALPYMSSLLAVTDQDVLTDTCWALSYLTDGPNERIEGVQTTENLLPRLLKLLQHRSPAVRTPALRAVGNMLTGSDVQTDRCLRGGCLEQIAYLMRCGQPSLVKEAAWALSNVLAGTTEQIQMAIDAGMLTHLVHVLKTDDIKSQKEAAWAVTNLCLGGTAPQLDALVASGFLEPYCALLGSPDHRAISVVLEGLTRLLQAAARYSEVENLCLTLEEIGALDKIESLQEHENEEVYKKSLHILDTYFAAQEDKTAQPEQSDEQFTFGVNNPSNLNF